MSRLATLALLCCWCYPAAALPFEVDASGATLTGTVSDEQDSPLAGVRVDITTAAPKTGPALFCPSCYRGCEKWAVTDATGRFEIKGLDPRLKFRLICTAPAMETLQTELIDPLDGPLAIALPRRSEAWSRRPIVSAIVVDEQGIPVQGALATPIGAKTEHRRWGGRVAGVAGAVSDANGLVEILLGDDMLAVELRIVAEGSCGAQTDLLDPDMVHGVTLPAGATVTGRIASQERPVANLDLAVVQTDRSVGRLFIKAVSATTDADGRFEIKHLPPDQEYCIYSLLGETRPGASPLVLAAKLFDAPRSDDTVDLGTLEADEPIGLSGRIETTTGEPLDDKLRIMLMRDPPWDLISIKPSADGTFQIDRLSPETYELRISDRNWTLITDNLPYQPLSLQSFGIHLQSTVDQLTIPVRPFTPSR